MNLQRKKQDRQSTLLNISKMLMDAEEKGEEVELDDETMEMLEDLGSMNEVFSFGLSLSERAFFNTSGTHLTLCHPDGVVVWDIKKAQPQFEFFAKPDYYDVSRDGQRLVIIEAAQEVEEPVRGADIRHADPTFEDNILIYNVSDAKPIKVIVESRSETKRVRFLPGTSNIMVLGVTGDRYSIDGISGALTHEADVYKGDSEYDIGYFNEATESVLLLNASIAMHPTLPLVAATDLENNLMVYDYVTRQKKISIPLSNGAFPGVHFEVLQFTPNGKYLFAIRQDYTADDMKKSYHFWDINTGKEQKTMEIDISPWTYFFFTPDGRWFVTSKLDNKKNPPFAIQIYDANTLTQTETIQGRGPFATFPNDPKRLLFFTGTGVGVYTLKP
jgi:WD40 repeat protein